MGYLEEYFKQYREKIIGNDTTIETPYGQKKLVYADWIASGRLYSDIEDKITSIVGPLVGNTHSESSATGIAMTKAYQYAQKTVKAHVNASENDVIIFTGTGMTAAIAKLQRIMGLKIPEQAKAYCYYSENDLTKCSFRHETLKPVVFITHTEHHSNHTSWLETIADVVVIEPGPGLIVDPVMLQKEIVKYKDRPLLIGSFSACSNVTGYFPPVYQLARIMHEHGGYCFVDYAASAPYEDINMHPGPEGEDLDAIFFSPHKFLGGPGTSGVLIFNKKLYKNTTPDKPGGGTVKWTNRWGGYSYVSDIEAKEDGGTPGFIQGIRTALAVRLKETMNTKMIRQRELELIRIAFNELGKIPGLHILADNIKDRLGVFSFYIDGIHHNLVTIILNDRFGIQVRGGCSCAGTYGHYLLDVDFNLSKEITDKIESGDLSLKPGWIRLSLHPTMTDDELYFITGAIRAVSDNIQLWKKDYLYDKSTNEFFHHNSEVRKHIDLDALYSFPA